MIASRYVVLVVLTVTPLASGVPITFYYSGLVTRVDDPHGLLDGSIVAGVPFSGSYTFESTMVDEEPNDPTYGWYRLPAPPSSAMVTSIGNYTFVGPSYEMTVDNNLPGGKDWFGMRTGEFQSEGFAIGGMFISVTNMDGTAFASDALPLTPPPLERFVYPELGLWGGTATIGTFGVFGSLSSLTPEPQTTGLLGLTSGWLILMGGRRRLPL